MSKINPKIVELVTQSINTLRTTLSADELVQIKAILTSIYEHKISVSESWDNIETAEQISTDKLELIEEPFDCIGSLISKPGRGPINILRDAYNEDSSGEDSFWWYQREVIGYVHDQIESCL
ncbi:MAG TPA: hypothetical protein LFW21_02925 [Rickettsia endosymbiont of Pyrocoelia pectoralis]|nr:hypothetical protein [Rickettsia endosymbiont of Pyrocoelia pectoralis]